MQPLLPKIFKDRLTTTDETGHRVRVIPAEVHGRFQRAKEKAHVAMVVFFLALPWAQVHGAPALQLDVPHRRFFLLGHLFLPQDVPGLFFIVGTFALTLVFISALWGRVWCGWACPQTVFIEGFFRRVERWIEGNHLQQRELDKQPWNFKKVSLKSFKWAVFAAGSLIVTHSFLAYFVGANNVLQMVTRTPAENPGSFAVVLVSTAVILFDFGWFREQFCLIACPYGRFQSVMMDDQSVTIAYDAKRGEPRKGTTQGDAKVGDCINCFKCVRVCPTGIDIRNGFQMECIACTACADVCDEVMLKIGKPIGLVRYASEAELRGDSRKMIRPRIFVYAFVLTIMLSGLIYRVATQQIYQAEVLRAIDTPYQVVTEANGRSMVINHFKVNWYNLSPDDTAIEISLSEDFKAQGFELIQQANHFQVQSAKAEHHQFFLKFPLNYLNSGGARASVRTTWHLKSGDRYENTEVSLVGPSHSI